MYYPLYYVPIEIKNIISQDGINIRIDFKKKNYNPPFAPLEPRYPFPPDNPFKSLFITIGILALINFCVVEYFTTNANNVFGNFIDNLASDKSGGGTFFAGMVSILIIGLLLTFISFFFVLIQHFFKTLDRCFSFFSELKEYKRYNAEYPSLMREYDCKKNAHLIKCKEYDTEYNYKYGDSFFRKLLKEKIADDLKEFGKYVSKPNNHFESVKIGFSEKYFYHVLTFYFPNLTITQNQSIGSRTFSFYPDFSIILENGLCIDVEIDEPYSELTKQPIHYLYHEDNMHCDTSRNEYFLSKGWCVIRFAEIQIINSPIECCKYLAEKIDELLSFSNYREEFEDYESLQSVDCWTYATSADWIKNNYRLTYINDASP